jgi:putative MATE family efflux protein
MSQGPFRRLFVFAVPIFIGNLLYPLSGSLTAILVGRYLGEDQFAITLSGNLIVGLALALLIGVATAAGVLVAQRVGARDFDGAKGIVRAAAIFQIAFTLLLSVICWLAAAPILAAFGLSERQMAEGIVYLRVLLVATLPISLMQFVTALLRGFGDSRTGFNAALIAVAINMVLNFPCIFGLGFIPGLGVTGAAAAELAGYVLALIYLLILLARRRDPVYAGLISPASRQHDQAVWWIVPRGLAIGTQSIVVTLSAVGVTVLTNRLGSHTTAAFGAAAQIWGYVQMPAFAIAAGVTSLAAQAIGAADQNTLRQLLRAGLLLLALSVAPAIFAGYFFGGTILRMFLPNGSESFVLAVEVNGIVLWSYATFAVSLVLLAMCRASGTVLVPLLINVVGLIAVRFLLLLPEGARADPSRIAWSMSISIASCALMASIYYRSGRWNSLSTR